MPSLVPGMTLRDWFAGQSLTRLEIIPDADGFGDEDAVVARHAYAVADAMMVERARDPDDLVDGDTVAVTAEEGGQWISFDEFRGDKIHAIKFSDGRIWDAKTGWRPRRELKVANADVPLPNGGKIT
jgi:hypothetical protein